MSRELFHLPHTTLETIYFTISIILTWNLKTLNIAFINQN